MVGCEMENLGSSAFKSCHATEKKKKMRKATVINSDCSLLPPKLILYSRTHPT